MKIVSSIFVVATVLIISTSASANRLLKAVPSAADSTQMSKIKCEIYIAQVEDTDARSSRIGIFRLRIDCDSSEAGSFDRYRPPYIQLSKRTRSAAGLDATVKVFATDLEKDVVVSAVSKRSTQEFDADKGQWTVSASSWFRKIEPDEIDPGEYFMWITFESIDKKEEHLISNEIKIRIE